jgi:hypothetical protein
MLVREAVDGVADPDHPLEEVDDGAPVVRIVRPALEVLGALRDTLDRSLELVEEPIA